jgi:hypothetical protein
MANLLNSVTSEFGRLMLEYETIYAFKASSNRYSVCIITLIRSSTEGLAAAESRPTNTLTRGIKSGVRSEINYLTVNFTLTRAENVFLMSILESRMSH